MKTRIMVIDAAVATRQLVRDAIATDPKHEVVATASDGEVALQRLSQVEIALATLSLHGLDGLHILNALLQRAPHLPVIVLATSRSAALEALRRGASDHFALMGGRSREQVAAVLNPKIKALCTPMTRPLPIQRLRSQDPGEG